MPPHVILRETHHNLCGNLIEIAQLESNHEETAERI